MHIYYAVRVDSARLTTQRLEPFSRYDHAAVRAILDEDVTIREVQAARSSWESLSFSHRGDVSLLALFLFE